MNVSLIVSKYLPAVIAGFVVAFVVGGGLSLLVASSAADAGFMPGMVGALAGVFTAYIMSNLAGNRRIEAASDAQKQAVLDFQPDHPDQALLIVFREGFVGKAAGMDVSVDGRFVAQLKSPRFTAISVEPGGHQVSMAFGGLAAKQNKPTVEGFIAKSGEVIALRAAMAMGATKNRIVVERIESRETLTLRLKPMKMIAPESGVQSA